MALSLVASQNAAFADQNGVNGSASVTTGGNGVDLGATSGSTSPGATAGTGSTTITCTNSPLSGLHVPSMLDPGLLGGVTDSGQVVQPGAPGTWVYQECTYPNGTLASPPGTRFLPPGQPVDPVQLMQEARNHLSLPAPQIQMSPPAGQWQYVQMPTWAWVPQNTWAPLTASATAGAVAVTVTATPVQLVFDYQTDRTGATGTAMCNGPGTPYSDARATAENSRNPIQAASPDCGWTWHRSSADATDQKYAVSSHTVYHVTWAVTGAPGGGDLGALNGVATTFRVAVGEIQAINTPPR
jgi:hypothetical protein